MKNKSYIGIDKFQPFFKEVSDSYFLKLEQNILSNTIDKAQLKTSLISILKEKPSEFEIISVDTAYFERLELDITDKTSNKTNSTFVLDDIKGIDYDIPNQYFDELAQKISSRIPKESEKTKVWDLLPQFGYQPAFYIAATVMAFALVFGLIVGRKNSTEVNSSLSMDQLTKMEIMQYVEMNTDYVENGLISSANWKTELDYDLKLEDIKTEDLIITDEL